MDRVSVDERLRQLMQYFDIRITDIANKTGIAKSVVSMYVNGKREPRQDKIAIICDAYGLDPAWLIGFDVPMFVDKPSAPVLNEDDMRLMLKFKRLDENQRRIVKELIESMIKK